MSTKKTLELDDLFIRNLNFKDAGGFPIAPNKILFSRGDGGTFFGDLPLPCLSSVLRAFNEVRAGSNITLTASNSYNRAWFEPGSGIDFFKLTEGGQDKVYIYALAPDRLQVVGGDTLTFRDIPTTDDGRTLKYAAIGDISITMSTDTVFFQTQFNSSFSALESTISTTVGIQEQQEVLLAAQSTLSGQLQSTITLVDTLLVSTGTAALASTLASVQGTTDYMSTFLFRDTFQTDPSTSEYILRVSSIEVQNFTSGEYNIGSNTLTDTSLTAEGGRNYDVITNNGVVSTLTNYFFITDSYSEQQYSIKKEKLYSVSTVGPVAYTTTGANVETGWVPNISTLGDPFAPSLRDQFYPILQQTQIWEQLSTSSGNITLNYLLRNTGRLDTICAPGTLYINTSSLYVSSIRTDNAFSTGYLTYNPTTNEITLNTTGTGGGGGGSGTGYTGPTGASGADGVTGDTGAAGATGPTGEQGVPGTATNTGATGAPGDRYNTETAYDQSINPLAGSVTMFVGTGLAYIVGNSVLVIEQTNHNNYFVGIVSSYEPITGRIDINEIAVVYGSFGSTLAYNVNLNGVSGPTGNTGATGPTGFADRYATATTGSVTVNPLSEPVSLTIATGLAYIAGNAVLVVKASDYTTSFTGVVSTYTSGTGAMTIVGITNIAGSFAGSSVYNVNLNGVVGPTGATGRTGATGPTGATGSATPFTSFYLGTAGVGTVGYSGVDTVTFTQANSGSPGFLTTQTMAAGTPFSFTFTVPSFSFSQIYVGLRYTTASYASLLILQRTTPTTGTIYWYAGSTVVGTYIVGDTLSLSYNGTGSGTNYFLNKNGIQVATDSLGSDTYYMEIWFNAIVAGYPQTVTFNNLRFSGGGVGATGATGAGSTGPTGAQGLVGPTGPGGGGGGGGNLIYNDAWIQYYFIDPPPSTVMQSTTAKTTEIFVPWVYPTQIPIGLTNYWIPNINIFSASLNAQLGGTLSTITLVSSLSTNYVDARNGAPAVTGFVLSKVAGSSGFETRTFPGESTTRLAYVYYNTALSNLVDNSTNAVTVWYRNNNPSTFYASTPYSIYITAGPPSAPQNLTAVSQTATTMGFRWQTPVQIDINDPTSTAALSDYRIGYINEPIPGRRYGTPVYASTLNTSVGTVSTVGLSGLLPDSQITLLAAAKNNVSALYGQTASTITSTTNLAQMGALSGSLSFPARYYTNGTIRNIFTGATTTRLVNTSTAWTSDAFVSPVHAVASRGSVSTGIATMTLSMSGASGSLVGPAITYNGFPAVAYSTVTTSNLTLSTFVYDKYSTPTAWTGFYLDARDTATIGSNLFVPSSATYTLTAAQTTTNVGSATFAYQFDNILTAGPSMSLLSTNFIGAPYVPVSGVNVIYGAPTYGVSTVVSNMGNFFYRTPLLTVTTAAGGVTTTTSETGLSGITSGYNAGVGQFSSVLTFQTLVTSGSLATAYGSTITTTAVANNPLTASSTATGNNIAAIVDGPSATLVMSTIPSTITALSSAVGRVGARVYTGVAQGGSSNPYVPPFLFTGGSYTNAQYASILYNHVWDITNTVVSGTTPNTNEELQVFNGKFRTRTGAAGYYNYTPFYYTVSLQNTVNYSGIAATGYRYATYCWSVTPIVSGTAQYSALTFTLASVSPTPTISIGSAYVSSQKLLMYYRFEDSAAPAPTDANNLSSIWLDANTQGATVTSGNFFNPTDNSATRPGLIADPTNVGGGTTFTVAVPKPFQTGVGTVYLYMRVGLPMSVAFEFATASATLTATG